MSIILVVQHEQLSVYLVGHGESGCAETFLKNQMDVERFRRFLQRYRNTEFIVLLDHKDEQFNFQKMPRVGRRDKKAMLQHQQRKLYGDSPFASAVIVDHKDNAEPRISVTHVGLASDASDCVWLTTLEDADSCIRSFHWMSLLSYGLLQGMGAELHATMLLLRTDQKDDRIIVYRGRQPLINRRIAGHFAGIAGVDETADTLAEQVLHTLAYLQRLVESGEVQLPVTGTLEAVAIGDYTTLEIDSVNEKLLVNGVTPLRVLSSEVDTLTSRSAEDATLYTSEMLARAVMNKKAFSYSLIFHGVNFLQRKLRHALYAVSISLLAGTAIASVATRQATIDLTTLEAFATELDVKAIQVKQAHPHPEWSQPYSVAGVKKTVAQIELFRLASQSTPFHFLALVSKQLTNHAGIELTSIHWSGVDQDIIGSTTQQVSGKVPTSIAVPGGALSGDYTSRFSAIVTGRIILSGEGFTDVMKEFRSFVGSMRQSALEIIPGANVTVVTLPFAETQPVTLNSMAMSGEFLLEVNSGLPSQ